MAGYKRRGGNRRSSGKRGSRPRSFGRRASSGGSARTVRIVLQQAPAQQPMLTAQGFMTAAAAPAKARF